MSTPDELIVEVSENVLADVDPVAEEGEPHPIWSTMVELGWPHVGLAEPVGGPGGSLADLCALVSATARRGIGVPLAALGGATGAVIGSGRYLGWVRASAAGLELAATGRRPVFLPWSAPAMPPTWSRMAASPRSTIRATGRKRPASGRPRATAI